MKKYNQLVLAILILMQATHLQGSLFDYFKLAVKKNGPTQAKTRFPLGITEKKEQLQHLQNDLTELQNNQKDFSEKTQINLDQTTAQINEIKQLIKDSPASEAGFLNRIISILNETYQTLFTLQFSSKELLKIIEQHITLLEDFLKDPEFKSLDLKLHSFYTFEELQELSRRIVAQEDKVKRLIEQKNEALVDLDNRKRKINILNKEYQERKKRQEEFSSKSTVPIASNENPELDFRQEGKLLDVEETFYRFEKQLAELKVQEATRKIAFFDTSIALESEKLKLLKAHFARVKESLRIEPKDIKVAKEKLELQKKESLNLRDGFYDAIKKVTIYRDGIIKEIEALKKNYTKIDSNTLGLTDWSVIPKTIDAYTALAELGLKSSQITLLENKIETLKANIENEKIAFKRKEIEVDILTSWYKITRRQFKTTDEIDQELKRYQALVTELSRDEAAAREKTATIQNALAAQNKALSNIKLIIADLKTQRTKLFRGNLPIYNASIARFTLAEKTLEEQIEESNRLLKIYTANLTTIRSTSQELVSIISTLESKSIWQRSEYAISWKGIKNIGNDFSLFFKDIATLGSLYIANFDAQHVTKITAHFGHHLIDLFLLILKILALIFIYFMGKKYLPQASNYFMRFTPTKRWLLLASRTIGVILSFINDYFLSIFCWFALFTLIYFDVIIDLFLQVMFYLLSIIYFIYLINRFIAYIIAFNKEHNSLLFGQQFQKRFSFVFSWFGYLTVILLFFREAFILATYHASEFPTILLATYSIIIRTLIIFSIGKDEIISFIPSRGAVWQAVADFINRYYYPLLIFIIILMIISDSYVGGYGNLVSYVVWGVIGTMILIKLLLVGQDHLKKKASKLFFATDEETIKERFVYAKTWYGLFVVGLFVVFSIIGLILSLRIWGKSTSWQEISYILNYPLYPSSFDVVTGQHIWLTPMTILSLLGFICAGFILAFTINRFVLIRIFQLLPVDIGIQNTVLSLSRYLIVIAAIFLGFQWANLGWLLIGIGLVIGSIGYIVKEPISDFISYFIILVQRPLKIGDLVMVKNNLGVVRHITPRSVIIRTKNSYTVIVPNATIINETVHNWNYSRGFIAFDDIFITVPYSADPLFVKSIIEKVLDANTDLLKSPKPIIRLENFGENGYEFLLRGFLSSNKTLEIWDIASNVRLALVQALQKESIYIALPTRLIINEQQRTIKE